MVNLLNNLAGPPESSPMLAEMDQSSDRRPPHHEHQAADAVTAAAGAADTIATNSQELCVYCTEPVETGNNIIVNFIKSLRRKSCKNCHRTFHKKML